MSNLKEKFKYKLKAASIHLLLSLLVFIIIAYFIVFEWYPEGLFTADGGLIGLKLIAAIDLVLGPSLTFIIFNHLKTKKEIVFDLSIIAIVQLSALIWGCMQIYSQRPVALVMWEGVFFTITEGYLTKQNKTVKDISIYSLENPLIIVAKKDGSVEQLREIQRLNTKDIPPYAQVHLYQSVKDNIKSMLQYQLSDEYLTAHNSEYVPKSDRYIFPGTAKYENLRIHIDSGASLNEIQSVPK